jgi:hypothetical protein
MTSVAEIGQAVRTVLSTVGDVVARETGFTKRQSKLTGAKFAQTTVLGWLSKPEATLNELCQTAASLGVAITPQGLDDRFTAQAAALLKRVLDAALEQVVAADPVAIPLLARFNGVIVQDSSVISLPEALVKVWQGCGGSPEHGNSALKLQVRLDLLTGTLLGPLLEPGRTNDRGSALQTAALPKGALRLADLGYFSLEQLRSIASQAAFFLTRFLLSTAVFDQAGNRLDLAAVLKAQATNQLDQPVQIGAQQRLAVRLLAVRVPQEVADQRRRRLYDQARQKGQAPSKVGLTYADWTVLVTNVPPDKLALAEALVLARVRWQVELLFKLWKAHGKVDQWRTDKPWRILCETYAKLTAMIVQHWLFLVSCWAYPNRSLVKAAQTVRAYAPMLASALAGLIDIALPIEQLRRCLAAGSRLNSRRKEPNTCQLLLDLPEVA